MTLRRRTLAKGLIGLAAFPGLARAAAGLPAPTGHVILRVSGKIGVTNAGAEAHFDRAMLEALGPFGFTTHTPWDDGPVRFDGVKMSAVMQAVQPAGQTVVATALNDYQTRIPISDFTTYDVLLALKRDGEYMSVRNKGPLFIVYPFDANPNLQSQQYYGRCAWQLDRMTVV
jgi:hypothetical protein